MTGNAKIKVNKDGPYLVSGGIPLSRMVIERDNYGDPLYWRELEKYPDKESYSLCRCGSSGNKPYCDGSHTKAGFKGTETAGNEPYMENVERYNGPELKLTDKRELCARAGFCTRDAGIWNLTIHSDRPGFREIAIEEAADCPSGRLVVWDTRDNRIEPFFEPSIVVTEHKKGVHGPPLGSRRC